MEAQRFLSEIGLYRITSLAGHFKGRVQRFYMGSPRNHLQLHLQPLVSRIGQKKSSSNINFAVGPIRGTIKSTVEVTLKKNKRYKVARISEL